MRAAVLNGNEIGKRIRIVTPSRTIETDEITLITHKKNGNVIVRHGKENRQVELKPAVEWWHLTTVAL